MTPAEDKLLELLRKIKGHQWGKITVNVGIVGNRTTVTIEAGEIWRFFEDEDED